MIPIRAKFTYTGGHRLEVNSLNYIEPVEVAEATVEGYIHKFFINGETGYMEAVFIDDSGVVYRADANYLEVDMNDYNIVRRKKCQI